MNSKFIKVPGKQFTATDARFVYKRLISDALMEKIARAKHNYYLFVMAY
jgi:hypothetical protein